MKHDRVKPGVKLKLDKSDPDDTGKYNMSCSRFS